MSMFKHLPNLWLMLIEVKIDRLDFSGLVLRENFNLWEEGKGDEPYLNGKLASNYSYIVESRQAVVAADDGRCSEIGLMMLEMGGHAVDAAVATALCLGVVSPMSSGIGGGAFMVVRSSSSPSALAIDMRETAPAAASQVSGFPYVLI